MNRAPTDGGFTLLEVMVASLIMAIAISALLVNLHGSLRNVDRLSGDDRAAVFAQHKMDELLADPTIGILAHLSGPYLFGDNADRSGWSARTRPFEYPPNMGGTNSLLEEIHLEVWWTRGGEKKTFALNGYRAATLSAADMQTVQFLIHAQGVLQ
jgi:prepilin-type N-terminal cleavage/methylation domain-containing protein